ncbi:MAG: hypothetical protein EOP45_01395 [Sphingobacteriaceae bacterium]|nr:MAG: hypothetical protein EOP45_01395 [Sphingobacteriaceae bacterium]
MKYGDKSVAVLTEGELFIYTDKECFYNGSYSEIPSSAQSANILRLSANITFLMLTTAFTVKFNS